ncbi:Hypothetical Protein OBI_RACECAR_271 [Arthrobacter phage Racecar]|nr:hypothetical protein PBI_RACECAR_63 [Arthrobacter phage Racecar]
MEWMPPTAADYAARDAEVARQIAEETAREVRAETEALRLAEFKLKCLGYLAQGIIDFDRCPQYGRDIQEILKFTAEDMREHDRDGGWMEEAV